MVAVAAVNLATYWWAFTPGTVFPVTMIAVEILYVVMGLAMVVFLIIQHRRGTAVSGGGAAAT